ncbi:MAG: hypothetical protein VB092_07680 [Oscillospiraceae bacterium]|nr:hypothetical protein [Oscillospiraceae bacterium]
MKLPKKKKAPVDVDARPEALSEASPQYDPAGSWTGVPADGDEKPVQDADDL